MAAQADFLQSLRAETVAVVGGTASASPSEGIPASDAGGSGQDAAPPDAPAAPATEPPSQPDPQHAGESAPPVSPAPAPSSDAPTDAAYQRALQMAGGDPKLLGEKFLEYNNRLAETTRRLKELEAGRTQPQPPADAPLAQPPAAPPQTQTAPAPPAQPAEAPPIEQLVLQAAAADNVCKAYVSDWQTKKAELAQIDSTLPKLEQDLAFAERLSKDPRLDDYGRQAAADEARNLKLDVAQAKTNKSRLEIEVDHLDGKWQSRRKELASEIESRQDDVRRKADHDAKVAQDASSFATNWTETFDREFTDQKAPAELKQEIHDTAVALASAHFQRTGELNDLRGFIGQAIKAEVAKVDKYHRLQSRQHALNKNLDGAPQVAPGTLTTAPPIAPSDADPSDSLRRELRQRVLARTGGR